MVDLPDDEYEERVERARLARKEGRKTLGEQIDTLADIDEKAIQIFRLNILFAGVLVSGASIAISSGDASLEDLLIPYTEIGVVLLFLSTFLAAITYTSTSERIGVSQGDISQRILNDKYDYDLIEEEIAFAYGEWIRYNYERNISNSLLFTLTLMTSVGSVTSIGIGLFAIYDPGVVTPYFKGVIIGLFLLFGKLSGVYGQTRRWWVETSPGKRFMRRFNSWKDKFRGDTTGTEGGEQE